MEMNENGSSVKSTYDYIIVGSGFGGSVSALRLSEKGYKVLVIEKGRWFKTEDFPENNRNLKQWLWEPRLGWKGFFKMTFFRHVTVLSGVGVGGGSLTYANTLPIPKTAFFNSGNWQGLADWEKELKPHYDTAYQMLGANQNPNLYDADKALEAVGNQLGKADQFHRTQVAVYFGKPGEEVADPYFGGKGPTRTGCIHCGQCMTGCRHNAKNTLDKNYLYLAQQLGADIMAETLVKDIQPIGNVDGSEGYQVITRSTFGKQKQVFQSKGIVFSGGVLGTVPLLLKLKEHSLPRLSDQVGKNVRTNNEALIGVVSTDDQKDFSKGLAIGSILHTDPDSHLEPCRYGEGSDFFKWMVLPMVTGSNAGTRILKILYQWMRFPIRQFNLLRERRFAQQSTILLFMQHLDSTLQLVRNRRGGISTKITTGKRPSAQMRSAHDLARLFERQVAGHSYSMALESFMDSPTTAHILGGAVMGASEETGVIDVQNRVFNYENMYVCDGSMISANPGVNPSLSITAIAERAMSLIPSKD